MAITDHVTGWTLRAQAGEPTSVVRVRGLQTTSSRVGTDAWGRVGKPQPVRVSAEAWLAADFAESAAADEVDEEDTIHYGKLAKAILGSLHLMDKVPGNNNDHDKTKRTFSLSETVDWILAALVGCRLDGTDDKLLVGEYGLRGGKEAAPALLGRRRDLVKCLSITVSLPKATLSGEGVSFTGSILFREENNPALSTTPPVQMYSSCLRLHRLQIPTLIGVNANEREAKQAVIVDLEVECPDSPQDIYVALERIIRDAMTDSDFATLEALAMDLHSHLTNKLEACRSSESSAPFQIRVRLEKPVAIPLADGAVVEFMIPSHVK